VLAETVAQVAMPLHSVRQVAMAVPVALPDFVRVQALVVTAARVATVARATPRRLVASAATVALAAPVQQSVAPVALVETADLALMLPQESRVPVQPEAVAPRAELAVTAVPVASHRFPQGVAVPVALAELAGLVATARMARPAATQLKARWPAVVAVTAPMVALAAPVARPDMAAESKVETVFVATAAMPAHRATAEMAARVAVLAATVVTRAHLVRVDSQVSLHPAISAPDSRAMVSPGDPKMFKVSSCTPWLSARVTSDCQVGPSHQVATAATAAMVEMRQPMG
jgi:hypothetical protein